MNKGRVFQGDYFYDEDRGRMDSVVKASGLSKKQMGGCMIHERAGSEWPEAVVQLAGAWPDFPSGEEILQSAGNDAKRSMPDHSPLRAQMPMLNTSSVSLLREDRSKR